MSRFYAVVAVCVALLGSTRTLAATSGTPSVGWLTIVGSEQSANIGGLTVYDTGYIQASAGSTTVIYGYSQFDTPQTIADNLAALFNSNSSSFTASVSNNVVIVTSKATGSSANSSLSASYGSYDPTDFGPSFQASTLGMIGGRDGPRNFPMIMYNDSPAATYADLPFVNAPVSVDGTGTNPVPVALPQLPGHSILGLPGPGAWLSASFNSVWDMAVTSQYDLSRIDAVVIDEPYTGLLSLEGKSTDKDPCSDDRLRLIQQGYLALQSVANHIKQTSPATRIWINFESNELDWMMSGSCAAFPLPGIPNQTFSLNAPYVDVVSLDDYQPFFGQIVEGYYTWLAAHPGRTGQQLALVPGVFVHPSGPNSDPIEQAQILEQYLDYAASKNQSCNLPAGAPATNACPVWIVAGFLYQDHQDCPSCPPYLGLADPLAAPINAAWLAELSNSLLPAWLVPVDYFLDKD